jgi:hypothetical protein
MFWNFTFVLCISIPFPRGVVPFTSHVLVLLPLGLDPPTFPAIWPSQQCTMSRRVTSKLENASWYTKLTVSIGDPMITARHVPNVDHLLVPRNWINMNTNNKEQIAFASPKHESQIKLCSGQGYENSIKSDPSQQICHKIRRAITTECEYWPKGDTVRTDNSNYHTTIHSRRIQAPGCG